MERFEITVFSISILLAAVPDYEAGGLSYPGKPETWYLDKEYTTREAAGRRIAKLRRMWAKRLLRVRVHRYTLYQDTGELTPMVTEEVDKPFKPGQSHTLVCHRCDRRIRDAEYLAGTEGPRHITCPA